MHLLPEEKEALVEALNRGATDPLARALRNLLMKEEVEGGEIEFGGKIPAADYEEFRRNFPQYGSVKWFVREAVRAANLLMRERKGSALVVEDSIVALFSQQEVPG